MRLFSTFFLFACGTTQKVVEPSDDNIIIDADGDGYAQEEDCNDLDSAVYPGAPELCDGIDNNCDDDIDENVTSTFYLDEDGDGFGGGEETTEACEVPQGYSTTGTDCDDASDEIYPGAPELCDGIDNNCDDQLDDNMMEWYADADGDGYGDPDEPTTLCDDSPQGFVLNADDCDDEEPLAYQNAAEVCDGIDNNCDGETDEGLLTTYYLDEDTDGFGGFVYVDACSAPEGYVEEEGDCNDNDSQVYPGATEVCDLIDNNCDGVFDEDTAVDSTVWYQDADGDGYGSATVSSLSCFPISGYVSNFDDCDDTSGTVYPGADEIVANGIDEDCNGGEICYVDADGDGYRHDTNTLPSVDLDCDDSLEASAISPVGDCDDGNSSVFPSNSETCDGIDNNCDGTIDEDSAVDASTFYADTDGDGYGDANAVVQSCSMNTGTVSNSDDCDDNNNTISPQAQELCDGVDNNCDGTIDEDSASDATTWYADADEDGYGDDTDSVTSCTQPNGYILDDGDCDDSDDGISPSIAEFCGSDDLNCDGIIPDCQNCQTILDSGLSYGDGLYTLETTTGYVATYCDMTTDGGGWTMVQRTVWEWADSQKLWTGYSAWYNSTLGSPAPGNAYRMAGVNWMSMNESGEQLLVHYARDASSGTNCDPLYYQGEAEMSVTSTATTVNNLSQPVGIMSGSSISTKDSGGSTSCVNGQQGVPWFYSSCCSTCPTYKGGYWNDEPHPMASYVNTTADSFGQTVLDTCPSGGARMNDNNSSFEGINEMEYYLR